MTYYERNKEWLLARQKAYYRNNKEYYQSYNEEYFQNVTKPQRQQCMEILRQHNLLTKPPSKGSPKPQPERQSGCLATAFPKEPNPTKEIPEPKEFPPLVYAQKGCVIDWTK
jgi:hypothetical protein